MAAKKFKLEQKAITEILVADTDSESGAEVSDVEQEFDEQEDQQEEEEQLILQQASADEPQASTSGGVLPPWGPPQGTNVQVHPFVVPEKGVKKSEAVDFLQLYDFGLLFLSLATVKQ
jgi:hypothetical protein